MQRRLSPALVIATVAVVLAGTGSAVAASVITSKNIKDGTIKLADLSKSARKSLAGKAGPQGARGAAGLNGAAGAAGPAGLAGPAGSARAYARVTWYLPSTQKPGFVAGFTKGFSDVTRTSEGRYCLTPSADVDTANLPVFVSVDWAQTVDPVGNVSASWLTGQPECPAPKIGVETMRIPSAGGDAVVDNGTSFTVMLP
jgi:hypothetical protein